MRRLGTADAPLPMRASRDGHSLQCGEGLRVGRCRPGSAADHQHGEEIRATLDDHEPLGGQGS